MNQQRRLFRLVLLTAILFPAHRSLAASRPAPKAAPTPIACPADIPTLTDRLLQDLPSYANRIMTRQKNRSEIAGMSYIVAASRPEFEPLPTRVLSATPDRNLHQVFFTTLEHRTTGHQTRSLQQYHWLFLAQTQYGWRLSQSYSRIGSYPAGTALTPPRESSQGPIAQAVVLWLRDCNAGALHNPPSGHPEPSSKLSTIGKP